MYLRANDPAGDGIGYVQARRALARKAVMAWEDGAQAVQQNSRDTAMGHMLSHGRDQRETERKRATLAGENTFNCRRDASFRANPVRQPPLDRRGRSCSSLATLRPISVDPDLRRREAKLSAHISVHDHQILPGLPERARVVATNQCITPADGKRRRLSMPELRHPSSEKPSDDPRH